MITVSISPDDDSQRALWTDNGDGSVTHLANVFEEDVANKIAHCLNHFEPLLEAAQIAEGALDSCVDRDPDNLGLLGVYTKLKRALESARPAEEA